METKKVRLTSDALNSCGTRVLTAGMDIEQYTKNNVLLYMHNRGEVIGVVEDIEKSDGEIVGVLKFDEASELSKRCKQQYEFGSLKMVSVGIDILEWSDSPEHLVQGQTRPTVTKSKLFEVSLVDIGANDDAITLRHNGEMLNLADGEKCPLPLLNNDTMENNTQIEELTAKVEALTSENAALLARAEAAEGLVLSQAVEAEVNAAIADARLLATAKEQFITLGKKIGVEDLKATLAAMTPRQTVSSQVEPEPAKTYCAADWDAADKAGTLLQLKREQPAEFEKLYAAKFGK